MLSDGIKVKQQNISYLLGDHVIIISLSFSPNDTLLGALPLFQVISFSISKITVIILAYFKETCFLADNF